MLHFVLQLVGTATNIQMVIKTPLSIQKPTDTTMMEKIMQVMTMLDTITMVMHTMVTIMMLQRMALALRLHQHMSARCTAKGQEAMRLVHVRYAKWTMSLMPIMSRTDTSTSRQSVIYGFVL